MELNIEPEIVCEGVREEVSVSTYIVSTLSRVESASRTIYEYSFTRDGEYSTAVHDLCFELNNVRKPVALLNAVYF